MSTRLYRPRPATVQIGADGTPIRVGRALVESMREKWLVEDRWWTPRPVRRRYFELTMADGASVAVFCDMESGRWYSQRGG
jgi:hypothetical protein